MGDLPDIERFLPGADILEEGGSALEAARADNAFAGPIHRMLMGQPAEGDVDKIWGTVPADAQVAGLDANTLSHLYDERFGHQTSDPNPLADDKKGE